MKLRKSKLAALLLSVMAVSAIGTCAYAESIVDVSSSVATYAVDTSKGLVWDFDKCQVTYYMVNTAADAEEDDYYPETVAAQVYKEEEATCKVAGYIQLMATIEGKTYYSERKTTEDVLAEHTYVETSRVYPNDYACDEGGVVTIYKKCSVCGDETVEYLDVDPTTHTIGTIYYVSNSDKNTQGGGTTVPTLIDTTKPGYYSAHYTCSVCGEEDIPLFEDKEISATTAVYARITASENIAYFYFDGETAVSASEVTTGETTDGGYYSKAPTKDYPLDENDIELINCDKTASYTITYYDAEWNSMNKLTIPVTAHHRLLAPVPEFSSKDDESLCTWDYDSDGSLVVTNNSCYKTVTYSEVVYCSADECSLKDHIYSSVEKTAEPSGDHTLLQQAKDAIDALVKAKSEAGTKPTVMEIEELLKETTSNGEKWSVYVTLSGDTSTCTEDGTVTVTYLCVAEPYETAATVYEEEIAVAAKTHEKTETPTIDMTTYVKATCETEGGYDSVYLCTRCGEILEVVESVTIPRLAHTNEIGDYDPTDNSLGKF